RESQATVTYLVATSPGPTVRGSCHPGHHARRDRRCVHGLRTRETPMSLRVVSRGGLAAAVFVRLAGPPFAPAPPPSPSPSPSPAPCPSGKFSGLMFGDYYVYDKWHQDQISATNTNNVEGQQGLWFRRLYFAYDLSFSERFTTRFRVEANSNGQFQNPGNLNPYIKDAYLKWTFSHKQVATLGIQPGLTI